MWSDFSVVWPAELLGLSVGPKMDDFQWAKPMRKFRAEIIDLKRASTSVSLNAYDYNTRTIHGLSYVSQLVALSPDSDQRIAMYVVYRALFNTLAHSELFQWSSFALPELRLGVASAADA